jgi:hypothetical protein
MQADKCCKKRCQICRKYRSKEIAEAALTKAVLALAKIVTTKLKQDSKNAAQKTGSAAKKCFIKNEVNQIDLVIKETLNGSIYSSYRLSAGSV